MKASLLTLLVVAGRARAHIAAWGPGMYCRNGTVDGVDDQDNSAPVPPLYNLPRSQWWFQAERGCSSFPPDDGDFLDIPAGGSFTVELANNRAFTTLSWDGTRTSEWPDGGDHPEDWNGGLEGEGCIPNGFMHTQNQSMAAGTAWAIAYESDLNAIAMEDLVVFSVLDHTPWRRIATYDVPAALPACPPTGCTCAWLWVANGCGEPNMYMQGFKCQVTSATSSTPISKAQPPVLCEDNSSKCVQGAKQMVAWNQQDGNNIEVPNGKFPTYSEKCGWTIGAQNDIFG